MLANRTACILRVLYARSLYKVDMQSKVTEEIYRNRVLRHFPR